MLPYRVLFLFINFALICSTKCESDDIAPPIWEKRYLTGPVNLSRAYVDENVALYYDSQMNESVHWPKKFLSSTWEYVKEVYGQFGSDPHLYVILRGEPNGYSGSDCDVYPFLDYMERNVIECSPATSNTGWALDDTSSIKTLAVALGKIIKLAAKGRGDNAADLHVCGSEALRDILTYDILCRQIVTYNKSVHSDALMQIENWKDGRLNKKQGGHYCFRDWYLPIYENYGGSSVLNNYFALTHKHWRTKVGTGGMNVGEFVHFWSGAVGKELTGLRSRAFDWENHMDEYLNATQTYTQFNYTEKNWNLPNSHQPGTWLLESDNSTQTLKLLYHTPEVAIYSQTYQNFPVSLYQTIAFTWTKMKESSSSDDSNTLLYILLVNETVPEILNNMLYISKDDLPREFVTCPVSLFFQSDGQASYANTMRRGRIVGKFNPLELEINSRSLSERVVSSPTPEPEPETILTLTWSVAYDIHLTASHTQNSHNRNESKMSVSQEGFMSKTETRKTDVTSFHWSQNWSFNSKDRYAGPVRFANLLNILKRNERTSNMPGAGYVQVTESAVLVKNNYSRSSSVTAESYDWAQDIFRQLVQKRSKFPSVSYVLEKNSNSTRKHKVFYKNTESQYKVTQTMTGNDTLAIHYNSSSPALIGWPFPLFLTTWTFLKRFASSGLIPSYSTNSSGQTLNIRFETKGKYRKQCSYHKTFKLPTQTSRLDDMDLHNVINCVQLEPEQGNLNEPNAWSTNNFENTVFLAKFLESQLNFTVIPNSNFVGQTASCAFKFSIYDMFKNKSKRKDEDVWLNSHNKDRTMMTSVGENGLQLNWLVDWCLPLYSQYGGTSAFNRFFALLDDQDLLNQNKSGELMELGKFINLWSLAAGSDHVLNLAVDVFGSTKTNLVGMMQARHNYKTTANGKSSNLTLAEYFVYQEDTRLEHYQLMRQATGNNLTTTYQATNIPSDIVWPLPLISAVWPYLQRYSSLTHASKVALIFSAKNRAGCRYMSSLPMSTLYNATGQQDMSHVMECGHLARDSNKWANYSYENAKSFSRQLQEEMDYFSFDNLTGGSVRGGLSTVIYQFFLTNGGHADAERWLQDDGDAKAPLYTGSDKNWLDDWCFLIYEKYGGSFSFEKFLQILDKRLVDSGHFDSLNLGQFLQMWSQATGHILLGLASDAFPWTEENSKEFLEAVAKRKNNTKSHDDIFIIYEESFKRPLLMQTIFNDTSLTISSDTANPTLTNWSFSIVSKTMPYVRSFEKTFNFSNATLHLSFSKSTPHLNLMFYEKSQTGCGYLLNLEATTYQETIQLSNVIACGYDNKSAEMWESPSYDNIVLITEVLSWNLTVSQQEDLVGLALISAFDLAIYEYFGEEHREADAARWLHGNTRKTRIFGRNKNWLEDWYLPIYRGYGKMVPIQKFLHLVDTYQGHDQDFESDLLSNTNENSTSTNTTTKTTGKINIGGFVHLWSAAIGDCTVVKQMAAMSIGWNQTFQDKFNKARMTMSGLNYAGNNCEDTLDRTSENLQLETSSATIIAIISVVIVLALCLGIKVAVDQKKMSGLKAQIRKLTSEEIHEFRNGIANNIYEKDGNKDGDANAAIHKLPFNTTYEIPKKNLEIDITSHLGSGEFGVVKKGSMKRRDDRGHSQTEVAVKMVKPNVEVTHFKALLSEIKIMAYLGIHQNIASLLGTVTDNIRDCEVLVALEFCAKGDLLKFIRKHEEHFIDLWNMKKTSKAGIESDLKCTFKNAKGDNDEAEVKILPTLTRDPTSSYENAKQLTTLELVTWASEIANGMEYISSKKVIHGDLAARNVLLTSDNVAKISDFGLSRQLINYSIYTKETRTPLPWRWMAPESLQEMKFSVHSDIWAFGVTLWEIFTLGRVPYPSRVWDHAFVDSLFAGQRLEAPEFGNGEIEEIMLDCMKNMPQERIDFAQMKTRFESLKVNISQGCNVVYTQI